VALTDLRDDLPVFTIGRVAELTGLSPRQLRYYEKKGLVRPARTAGNQRLYSREQVQVLQMIRRLLDEGYTLTNIHGLVRDWSHRQRTREDYPSREAFRREDQVSLYPLVNRARLLEILDRLDRRDRGRAARPG
jgi:MerR family glutamine synthetase transcriptional repressor